MINEEYRYYFASQEQLEQKELVFVKSQIAQLGKEAEKIHNCVFTVSIRNMAWDDLLSISGQLLIQLL